MPKGKPAVSKEIKDQILKRIKDDGVPVSQAASEHGLSIKTIYHWLGTGVTAPPSILEVARLRRENQALKQLIGQIMLDLDAEKKKTDGQRSN